MTHQSPSLVELHAFLAVYRLGSFRWAAEELCVTQAAVSRAVQRLEEHLGGSRLFDRSPLGVVPTEQGRQLHSLTAQHVAALEAAARFFNREATPACVRLSIATTLGTQWLMPRLPDFQARHPDTTLELRQFRHDDDFTRDDVDMWIDVRSLQRPWPGNLKTKYLMGRDIVPVCTPALAARLQRPADAATQVLLHHTNHLDNWARWFTAAGLHDTPQLGPGFDLSINLMVAAKAGLGIAIVPPCLAERELQQGELVAPLRPPVSTGRGYYLCHRGALTQAQRAFAAWVLAEARRTVERETQAGLLAQVTRHG